YTCPFVAIRGGQTVQMFPSQVGRAQNYTISLINFEVMPTDGQIELYNMQGSLLERNPLKSTQTTFEAPSYTGTYLIKVIIPNKDIYTFKLIVN
ncbi:MAG: T9SS type A sorting domain-containing protein, partial [Bacteroidales bacterium]